MQETARILLSAPLIQGLASELNKRSQKGMPVVTPVRIALKLRHAIGYSANLLAGSVQLRSSGTEPFIFIFWISDAATSSEVPTGFHTALAYLLIMENTAKTSVLYNATCPVCNFEILHYARYAGDNDLPIQFDDLNSGARAQWGLDADMAARRLYVLHEGTLTSGIPAFLVLWSQMPKYHWLARIVGFPGIRQGASLAYDHILAPAIYRWHLRRLRRQTPPAHD